jgi:hypothetical protein
MDFLLAVIGLIYLIPSLWAFDLIFYKDPNKEYYYVGGVQATIARLFWKFMIGSLFGFIWIPIALLLKKAGKR